MNTLRDLVDPYHEHRHVVIRGRLLRPAGLKTDWVAMSLFPSLNLMEERRKDLKPIAVGAFETYPDRLDASIGIPQDALVPILQMLIAERYKFVVLRDRNSSTAAPGSSASASSRSSGRTICRRRRWTQASPDHR
ncbi:hypothetical protein [Bradyrhizobium sp. SZCCHNRI1029]|uniref:hypothetical protein n=1 Tax=Bradyrhizobium sp. SZCCHNRI1029 TaxID=3057278 RepID=UPI002916F2F0|nr:hypothetical protein [Bradyrhizobium sp. SZCCHNRI1029]